MQDPFEIYTSFVTFKAHFTTESYDYSRYNGRMKVSFSAFEKRTDKPIFYQLAKILDKKTTNYVMVSQFVGRVNFHIKDLLEDPKTSKKIYKDWIERNKNIKEVFINDLAIIREKMNGNFRNALIQRGSDYPELFKLVCGKFISPECYAILTGLYWSILSKNLNEDDMFQKLNLKFRKYRLLFKNPDEDFLELVSKFA